MSTKFGNNDWIFDPEQAIFERDGGCLYVIYDDKDSTSSSYTLIHLDELAKINSFLYDKTVDIISLLELRSFFNVFNFANMFREMNLVKTFFTSKEDMKTYMRQKGFHIGDTNPSEQFPVACSHKDFDFLYEMVVHEDLFVSEGVQAYHFDKNSERQNNMFACWKNLKVFTN